jgi:signal transduction histidine kinase
MHPQHATTEPITRPDPAVPTLRGRRLLLARGLWAALAVPALILFFAGILARHSRLGTPPEAVRAGLEQLGLSIGFYAAYSITLGVIFFLGCIVVAAMIFWHRSDDGMALLVSLMLVLFGTVNNQNMEALAELHPAWSFPALLSLFLASASLILFLFLFPDGRFVPRWTRVPVLLWGVGLLFMLLLGLYPDAEPLSAWAGLMFAGGTLAGAIVQIYRYVRVSSLVQRQQTKWVVFGTAAAIAGATVASWAPTFFPALARPGVPALFNDLAGATITTISLLLIPLSIGVAILRYRLFDIDLLINRTLVYGALTVCVVGLYVLVVGYLGALFRTEDNLLISLVATGLVAVLFQPLRERLQRGVDRLMYGERKDPYRALSRLGERLEATLKPEAVLPTVVRTVREALKLPYAAIALKEGEELAVVAESGAPVDNPLRLPLAYQGEKIGELILAPRGPGEELSSADRRLLDDLARQAGIAAHAVGLTKDLQRSRERLVTTREEERRRLRRDLHDGLGPMLGSLPLKLDVAGDLMEEDPTAARALLQGLKLQAQSAVADIRRLVYALRPPALDDLGLLGAVRETAAQHVVNGLNILVEAPESLPDLPAAVEVAAYRIIQEAITNVARHAAASECVVRLTLDQPEGALLLEIDDDGRGLPTGSKRGVGLSSMGERAAELGGSCVVESLPEGGTRVRALLPCATPKAGE